MKKIVISVLAAAAFLGSSQLFAQQKKHFISAGFNVSNQKYMYDQGNGNVIISSHTEFNITPAYGYYFKERWAIGIQGSYGNQANTPEPDAPKRKGNGWGVGPFIRYEQPIWNDRLSVYADGILSASFNRADSYVDPANNLYYRERKTAQYGLTVVPGLLFHLTPSFSLTANMGNVFLANTRTDKIVGASNKTTGTEVGLFKGFGINNVVFGINFHF